MGIRLTTNDPATRARPRAEEPAPSTEKSGAPALPADADVSELSQARQVDGDARKTQLERVRKSDELVALLKSAKDAYAGAAAVEPEHLTLALAKHLGLEVPGGVEKELLAAAKAGADPSSKGMSARTADLFVATGLRAGAGKPAVADLLAVMKSSAEPFAAHLRELSAEQELKGLLGSSKAASTGPTGKQLVQLFPTLSALGEELVAKAADGKLDRAVGRNEEIEQVTLALMKRQLSSLVLTGSPGVGKTAIVEGMARAIADGEMGGPFKNARIFAIDANALKKAIQSGTTSAAFARGACPTGGKGVLEDLAAEVAQAEKTGTPVVLFIDEIHQLASGLDDIANRLKPYLSRGALRIVGATTNKEYRSTIAKDEALQDRFPELRVAPPTPERALEMTLANLDKFAEFHGVEVDASAAARAVELSRYHQTMENPRASIDWLDRAGALVKLQLGAEPSALTVLKKDIEDKKKALTQVKSTFDDPGSERTRAQLTKELDGLVAELKTKLVHAEKERGLLEELQGLGSKLRAAVESGDPEAPIAELKKSAGALRRELELLPERFYHLRVNADAVSTAVSKATGIDLSKVQAEEEAKYLKAEERLGKKVVGQAHVVEKLADELRADRAQLRDMGRPIGVHLFAGPTGVGKTELAKALANDYYSGNLVRFDCNELQNAHELAKLKGAPPGYVGFEGGSAMAEAIRKAGGRAVLLFDEIEKAHPSIMQLLMQIMDEGRFTDNEGRVVDCTNVHIVMTSNLGSPVFAQYAGDGAYTDAAATRQGFQVALSSWIAPEVQNRFSGIHIFNPLGKSSMGQILDNKLGDVRAQLEKTHGLELRLSDAARQAVIEQGYSPKLGGRHLNRAVSTMVRQPLAEAIIARRFSEGAFVMADVDPKGSDRLVLRPMTPDERAAAQAGG